MKMVPDCLGWYPGCHRRLNQKGWWLDMKKEVLEARG